jgi:DNA modification methylase
MFALTWFDEDIITDDAKEDDDVPDKSEKATSKMGDIYQLGEHRLMCGNSIDEKDVEKLMDGEKAQMCFTDPPYNIDYQGGMSTHKQNKREGIMNDKMENGKFYEFLSEMTRRIVENVKGGVYICMSSSELPNLKTAWEANGGHWQSFIIWVKNNFTLSRADYQNTYEPILYGWAKGIKNHYFIDRRDIANVWEDLREVKTEFDGKHTSIKFQGFEVKIEGEAKGIIKRKKQRTDIWRYDKPTISKEHPTMKPVALCLEAVKNSSQRGETVLDIFGGSGSTLIACEKANRKARIMELDPQYVDVIIKRWEEYTGQKAQKIN